MPCPDPTTLKLLKEHKRDDMLFCVARRPGSARLYAGSSDSNVYLLDPLAEQLQLEVLSGHTSYVTGVAVAGCCVVSGAYDGQLIWWDLETHQQIRAVEAHQRWIRGVTATTDGTKVASVADDMVCRVWDAATADLVHELRGHELQTPHHFPSMLFTCAFSPDGSLLATADKVGHVIIWELATGKQLASVDAPQMYTWDPKQRLHSIGGVRSLAFSLDAARLAVGGIGQIGNIDHLGAAARVEVFDWKQGQRTHEFPGDEIKGLVERLAFCTDGHWLLGGGGDNGGFLKFFDLAASKVIHQDKAPMHVHDLVLNDACDTIYGVGHGKVAVWQLGSENSAAEG